MDELQTLKRASAVQMKTYSLTVLTPLMMHGWQKRITKRRSVPVESEVRALSIKGILRYWWRTLQDEPDRRKLLADETKLFGGMAGDNEATQSPLMLRLEKTVTSQHPATVLPHSSRSRFRTLAIKSGEKFNLIASNLRKDEAYQHKHRDYITYMLFLSGFGQRARRGAGAVQNDDFHWRSVADYQHQLQEVLAKLGRHQNYAFPATTAGHLLKREGTVRARHPVLISVWAGRPMEDAEEVRRQISDAGHVANRGRGGMQWLGSTLSGRFASPLHATVRQIGSLYIPVISEVWSPHLDKQDYQRARNQFLEHLGVNL